MNECTLCYGKGVFATLVHINEHGNEEVKLTFCTDCEHGKTFYIAHDPFHFKIVEQFIVKIMAETWLELDEDGWVHNMRTTKDGIKFSSPLKTIEHLVEEHIDAYNTGVYPTDTDTDISESIVHPSGDESSTSD